MFASDALGAVTIAAGTWRVGLSGTESNAAADVFHNVVVYVWRPGTGTKVGTIFDTHSGTGFGAEIADGRQIISFSGSAVTVQAGDRIVFEWWHHWLHTMASAYTSNIKYDDGTELDDIAVAEGSWVEVPQDDIFGGGGGSALTQDVNDTLSLADSVNFDRQNIIADTVGLADAIKFDREKVIADTVAVADDAVVFDHAIEIDDTISLSDSTARDAGKGVSVNDTLTLADSIKFDRQNVIADTLSLADALRFQRDVHIADSVSVADDAVSYEFELVIEDSVGLADSATTAAGKGASLADTLSLADTIRFDRQNVIADTLALADALNFQRQNVLTESLALADSISFQRDTHISDAVALSDAVSFQFEIHIADTLSVADFSDPVKTTGSGTAWTQNIDDNVSLADARNFQFSLSLTEALPVRDSRSKLLNGDFLEEGTITVSNRAPMVIGRF